MQGSLPAPCKITIKNYSGAQRRVESVHLGNYLFNGNDGVDPIFRGEEAAAGTSNVFITDEGDAIWWVLTSSNLLYGWRGQFGRMIGVFTSRPDTTTLVRASLHLRLGAQVIDLALAEPCLNQSSHYVLDLGSIPLPPSSAWQNSQGYMNLGIKGKTVTGTDTIGVDWIQIFPAGAGRYRLVKGISMITLEANEEIVDDGLLDSCYALSGGWVVPLFRPLFTPIHLWPGKLQRLRMLISSGNSTPEAGQGWGVRVQTRFRRLSL